ncbi:Protein air1 [Hypsizygus marmoreus]|uniref:Protein air1 n=1 Tax=Hypsizygus marmoreus TaxID=39966 RepID=A0A369JQN7_HYPMA|nr:Protein air1 [Hypsizygus marmoreus]
MENDIIDLTISPVAEYIVLDDDNEDEQLAQVDTQTETQAGQDREKRRSRRKKRKRTLTEGDSQSSATHTREQSVEEGEIDSRKRERSSNEIIDPSGSAPQPDRIPRRKDRNTQRENRRRRSYSPHRQKTPPSKEPDLFFIDIQPAPLPPTAIFKPTSDDAPETPVHTLLLPAHVSVFGAEPVEILPPSSADLDEEDYIEYLDFDDRKDIHRYFEDTVEESNKKPNRTVCKNCGAEGEHKTAACPVLICLTCGARNEHSTRSCPISKTCFTCGMKGHINATCPNRRAARRGDLNRYDDCDRCGSELHKTNECPTLWRLYEYLTEEGRDQTLRNRKDKQSLKIGQGGEGYIADDQWCYNCGGCGHWGDDCQDIPHQADLPNESSAFSIHNTLSGPFFDAAAEPTPSTSRRRGPRDWEQDNGLPQDWGRNVPENVGRQARRNNIAKMEQRVKEQAVEDDPDDWFGNSRNARNRGAPQGNGNGNRPPTAPKKMSFGKSLQDSGRQFQPPPPPPSLLDRLGDSYRGDSRSRYHDRSSDSRSRRQSDNHYTPPSRRADVYRPDRERDRYRRREDSGPRYKGGYSR